MIAFGEGFLKSSMFYPTVELNKENETSNKNLSDLSACFFHPESC